MLPSRPLGIWSSILAFSLRRSRGSRIAVVLAFACFLGLPRLALAQKGNSGPLIIQKLDETRLTLLRGNTHPLARAEFDRGPAPVNLSMQRMLLVLTRSAQQEAALQTLLEEQQDKTSPNFHKWLTPDEFGAQFGASEQAIQMVTAWLQSHGFQIDSVPRGHGVIEFSGSTGQVQAAFHTAIHNYMVNGASHWANASDPQIPSALAPLVAGVDSLNNFGKRPLHHVVGVFAKSANRGRLMLVQRMQALNGSNLPLYTSQCGSNPNTGAPFYCNGITPYDFATIYNVLPLWNATTPIDGTGQSIAIVARSNINLQDVTNFRSVFGLPANPPQVILDGPDPGIVQGEDETEADLDVEWSGAIAKGSTIKLVVSESTEATDGIDLSAEYIVDNVVAPIMSESFGQCELFMGTAGNQFYNSLWEQAAAEGISVFVSSGDQGSAGCDFFQGNVPQPAKNGLEVSGIASTPYNVAVGGTDFDDFFNPLTYFNLTNNPTTGASAIGYVPETTWNSTCTNAILGNPQIGFSADAETNCNNSQLTGLVETIGGSGGKSNCTTPSGSNPFGCAGGYAKPAWQTGTGVPSDNKRDLPDVSLFASDGFVNNFYVLCELDAGGGCGFSGNFVGIGGTSASSPAFAGLMALIDQKQGMAQGNPNFILYKLAATQSALSCNSSNKPASSCVFNDVTSGTIATPCATGTLNCTTSHGGDQYGVLSGYNAASGYDLATGLGTVNANNLVSNWGNVKFTPSSTTLALNGGKSVNVAHGSPISVSVSVSPTAPTPTGDVSLIATQGNSTFGFDTMTLNNGSALGSTNMLPGGTSYTVKAHYEGDQNYGGSYSSPVTVTVTPEASQTGLRILTFDPTSGQLINPNAATVTYGSLYLLRADVMNSSGTSCVNTASVTQAYACPTGSVAIVDNGSVLNSSPLGLNSQGYTENQAIQLTGGTHNLAANYSGDKSYNASSGTDAVTVTPAATTTVLNPPFAPGQNAVIGQMFNLTSVATSQSSGAAPGGTFKAFDGTTQLGPAVFAYGYAGSPSGGAQAQGNFFIAISGPSGPHTLTAQYSGDTNYAPSASAGVRINAVYPVTMTETANPSTIIYGNSVTITATVDTTNPASNATLKPTGTVSFYGISGPVTTTTTQDPSGNWELQASVSFAPQSTQTVYATYNGDSNYTVSQSSTTVFVTIPDFSVSSNSPAVTITAGQTGTTTLTITPATNYTSTVQLSCGSIVGQFGIPGGTCTLSPASVTLSNGQPATATLTLATTAPSSNTSAELFPISFPRQLGPAGRSVSLTLGLVAGFLAVLFASFPKRQRRVCGTVIGFVSVCLLSFAIGCGGGASGSSGPVPTTTTISTASTKVPLGSIVTLTATVHSSKPASGTVNINAPACNVFSTNALVGGTAQAQVAGGLPGTCVYAAQYGGDGNNMPSQSGNLSIVQTGTVTLPVIGQTGADSHTLNVTVTIQ